MILDARTRPVYTSPRLSIPTASPVVRLLRELIAIPSVNPALLSYSTSSTGEGALGEFVAAKARARGLEIEFQPVAPGRANVLVRLAPRHRRRYRVIFAPHLDTVDGENAMFHPRVSGGRVYGRGACDTKGSVAAMLSAVLNLAETPDRPSQTEVVFAGLVDEEFAQTGSRHLASSRWKAQFAVVGEPTRLRLVTAHKGDVWLALRTRGTAAHGAQPHRGKNAVLLMSEVVRALEIDYAELLRKRRHDLLGHPTVNVGAIRGGHQPNIVPDECVIQVDRRTLPGETAARTIREVRSFLRSQGLRAAVSDLRKRATPALETVRDGPWVRRFSEVLGRDQPAGVDYFCDAAILSMGGIPSVVFGPGDIAQAHTSNEWISVRSLEQATSGLQRFLAALP